MPERDTLEVDALIVGAGPAGLSAAYRLRQLMKDASIAVLEKGREVGAHILSGAVMDPRGIDELIPDWKQRGAPLVRPVEDDRVLYLTKGGHFTLPITPPPLRNHGNFIISLSRFVRWLGEQVEQKGIDLFSGFAATEPLIEGDRLVGVRTGDKGIDRSGSRKGNYEPGIDIRAKVTLLAEGVRGSLTKRLISRFDLARDRNPQVYAVGIKEVWDVPAQRTAPGWVVHTMGWPLKNEEFGGGFIYNMVDGKVSMGLVLGLDYPDPQVDPHELFQRFKTHPYVRSLLAGGSLHSYGAKAIPEGGYWAQPRYYFDGGLIVGDSAGFLNSMRLKGIHLAIKSGMLAAEAAAESIAANDFSSGRLRRFQDLVEASWIKEELWKVRNFHQSFERGFVSGMFHAGLQLLTGGRGLRNRYQNQPGHARMQRLRENPSRSPEVFDRKLTFEKLTDVYSSGTAHDENQPGHLIVLEPDVCASRCTAEYGNPCRNFCPAAVYEWVDGRLQINASNCVHCKTCDIMDPYQIIDWVPPEGGGGPSYDLL